MSQREQILRALMEAGSRGIHSFEFYERGMPRFAARIEELRKDGHEIDSRAERYRGEARGVRYRLRRPRSGEGVSRRAQSSASGTASSPEGESLFDPSEFAPTSRGSGYRES